MQTLRFIVLALAISTTGWTMTPHAVRIEDGLVKREPPTGAEGIARRTLRLPRTWMRSTAALEAAHRQTGLRYAVATDRLAGTVGPFTPGAAVTVDTLLSHIATAETLRLTWQRNIAVFEMPEPTGKAAQGSLPGKGSGGIPDSPLRKLASLEASGTAGVVALTALAGHADASVRLHALAALQRMEGDFMRRTWPGRVSILELLCDGIDRNALLYAMESAPIGTRSWKLAVELLGRAREPFLARHLWEPVWMRTPGAMEVGLWGLGRGGDTSGRWAMRGRIRDTFSNDPTHRFLAGMALGMLNGTAYLKRDRAADHADRRRAVAFGLGFCSPDDNEAHRYLVHYLEDADAAVRYLACLALARRGDAKARTVLLDAATSNTNALDLRAAALEALVLTDPFEGGKLALALTDQSEPVRLRARAAALFEACPDPALDQRLAALLIDPERTVRISAIGALAARGTPMGLRAAADLLSQGESDHDLAIAALLGLGNSHAPDAAVPLAEVAEDTDQPSRLRDYAVIGLARLANRAGAPSLRNLAAYSATHRSFAVRWLNLDAPDATAAELIPHLTGPIRDSACAAADALSDLGFGPGVGQLLEGSDVFDNHTRMSHSWGAVRAQGAGVTATLVEAASNRRSTIRKTAALALGGRLRPEAVAALVQLAADPDAGVRRAAVQSLGTTGDPATVDRLLAIAREDANLAVAREAARVLRLRDFRHLPGVADASETLGGTERDAGGLGARPSVAEQADHSFVLRAWGEHVEEDLVCNLTYESSLCYDRHNARIVMWGAHGRRYDTPQTAQTWFFRADDSPLPWRRLTDSRHWPNGACCIRGTAYDDANRVVISPRVGGSCAHGWHNVLRSNLATSSPWILDVVSDQWYAARPFGRESFGFAAGSHDPRHGVTLWWRNVPTVFDVYANAWQHIRPEGAAPRNPGNSGGVFDPASGRFIAVSDTSTWAFDPATRAWTDLRPDGPHPPRCPMVYDSANAVMLAFRPAKPHLDVWVFDITANRWEQLPPVHPSPGESTLWDAAYDERLNVTVLSGTQSGLGSASLNRRETWTYRYKAAPPKRVGRDTPRNVRAQPAADGSVTVTWEPPPNEVAGYRIEWGVADRPWRTAWKTVGETDARTLEFRHAPDTRDMAFYRVMALNADGDPSAFGFPARTTPRIVSHVTAATQADGSVRLAWTPPAGADVTGYHIYRTRVALGNAWERAFRSDRLDPAAMERLTDTPVAEAEFVDAAAGIVGQGNELAWPESAAYVIRSVNAWGLESGPSPVTLALPAAPGPVRVIPWADGRRLVVWSACPGGDVEGYYLLRMDAWQKTHAFRLHPGALLTAGFRDEDDFPRGDRRRYYAGGIDALGAMGIPSSGTWSHGYP